MGTKISTGGEIGFEAWVVLRTHGAEDTEILKAFRNENDAEIYAAIHNGREAQCLVVQAENEGGEVKFPRWRLHVERLFVYEHLSLELSEEIMMTFD